MELWQALQGQFPAFLLVALRASGLFLTAPLFGQERIPETVRILLSVALAALVFPYVGVAPGQVPDNAILFLVMGLKEVLTGIIYGWSAMLMFEGLVLAGQFIGLQMGYAQANILNPMADVQRPLLSEIYFMMGLLIFFAMDGHHFLVVAFQKSFQAVPVGKLIFSGPILERLIYMCGQIFVVALIIAAPICGVLTLMDLILGLIARTAPQMNVLLISFSLKIYIGLLTLVLSLPFTFHFVRDLLHQLLAQIVQVL